MFEELIYDRLSLVIIHFYSCKRSYVFDSGFLDRSHKSIHLVSLDRLHNFAYWLRSKLISILICFGIMYKTSSKEAYTAVDTYRNSIVVL